MTLPFDNSDTKKWQCFVCGMMFSSYQYLQEHILEEHEEGRDYVRCPLQRCGACVRDLRLHFKVKHKNEKLPKVPQYKAMVWRDFSKKGKKKTRKPKFKQGNYLSSKTGKSFLYRSGYEEAVFECLDSWNEVSAFHAEPFRIPYSFKGKSHEYIPDIMVIFTDGHQELWEIKPESQTHLEQNQKKWKAAKECCEKRGWGFQVVMERDINKLKKIIKEQAM
jgi:hypothetical protein